MSTPPAGPTDLSGALELARQGVLTAGAAKPLTAGGAPTGDELYALLAAGDPKGDAAVKAIYKDVRLAALEGRAMLERGWWQKLLYVNGRQWIYHTSRGGWQDKRLARWIPRPVTNICAETIDAIRSMLISNVPTLRVRPNGNDPIDVLTAQIADDLEPEIAEEHGMERRFFEADFWAPTLGCCFFHPYWDKDDPRNSVDVPVLVCAACHTTTTLAAVDQVAPTRCPACGQPALQPELDAQGQPVTQSVLVGSGATDVCSPLEMLIPTYFQRWEDVDRLIRLRWRPQQYYEGRPYFNEIRFNSSTAEQSLQMYRSLALMSDLSTAPFQWGGASPTRTKGAIEAELWIRPQTNFPRGLWCRAVGGMDGEAVIVRDPDRGVLPGPIPFVDQTDQPLWLWTYYPYRETGGRIWAMGALEPVIQKQDQINRNDSMVELIMQRMANPIWLEPKGAEVQRFTGEPGLIVRYQIVAGTNAKPERLEGMNPGQSFFQLRAQYLSDVEMLAGTQDVLKGMKPSGVEAFSALNLLVEQSQSKFVPILKARGRAYRDWYALALELERSYGPVARTKSVMGEAGTWTFQIFKRQDLRGAITVTIEDGSSTPKTSLGKRAAIQDAKNLGFINPQDTDTRTAGLQILGVPELAPGLDAQTKGAQVEQQQYEAWVRGSRKTGVNPLMVQAWQGHQIHLEQHDQWASSDAIRALTFQDQAVAIEITAHRSKHVIAAQNAFGLPMPPPPPPAPPDLPKVSVALTSADLLLPIVQELLTKCGVTITPLPPPGLAPTPGGPPAPGAPAPVKTGLVHPAHLAPAKPGAAVPPPQGAGMAMANANQEINGTQSLPGNPTGAGNMAPPA